VRLKSHSMVVTFCIFSEKASCSGSFAGDATRKRNVAQAFFQSLRTLYFDGRERVGHGTGDTDGHDITDLGG